MNLLLYSLHYLCRNFASPSEPTCIQVEIGSCCNHSWEVADHVLGQRCPVNLPPYLMNWVAVTIALTRFTKKVSLSYVWFLWSWAMCSGRSGRDRLVMLVTCHPPVGCDIGTMTAWSFGLSCCLSRACASGISMALVCSYCPVACDFLCDCPVACEWSCPNTLL